VYTGRKGNAIFSGRPLTFPVACHRRFQCSGAAPRSPRAAGGVSVTNARRGWMGAPQCRRAVGSARRPLWYPKFAGDSPASRPPAPLGAGRGASLAAPPAAQPVRLLESVSHVGSMRLTWRRGKGSLNTGNSAPERSDVRPLMTQPETRNPFVIDRSSVQVRSSASGLALDRESIGLSPPVWRRSDTPSKRFRNNAINTRCLIVVRPR
jgi:hypothetical protein